MLGSSLPVESELSWSPSIPPLGTTLWLGPLIALVVLGTGYLSGWLKLRRGVRTGHTRKLFHVVVFLGAAALRVAFGVEGVNLLGGIASLQVIYALLRGEGSVLYEGLARESDRPHRSLYVVLPLIATGLGGIASSYLFGHFAVAGFVVTGLADAVAEPVGLRWGRHRYRAPGLGLGVSSERSIEGSAAVFAASFVSVLAALPLALGIDLAATVPIALAVAAASTAVEAVSHHGLDNFTLQIAASGVAWALG
jgi:phytol kinase